LFGKEGRISKSLGSCVGVPEVSPTRQKVLMATNLWKLDESKLTQEHELIVK
jgi:hypothetical protein